MPWNALVRDPLRGGLDDFQKLGEVARGVTVFDSRPKSGRCIYDVTGQRADSQKSQLARMTTADGYGRRDGPGIRRRQE
jgi:hypothetical protein